MIPSLPLKLYGSEITMWPDKPKEISWDSTQRHFHTHEAVVISIQPVTTKVECTHEMLNKDLVEGTAYCVSCNRRFNMKWEPA